MFQTPDIDCIHFLTNQIYMKNHLPHTILNDFQFSIPLNQFICYCVGFVNNERCIQCVRILEKKPSDKITTIKLEWFNPTPPKNGEEWDSKIFWINSTISLRKFFFFYEDKFNFFRSTFIYYPEIEKYFRLCNLFNYLSLPESNPIGEIIYLQPKKTTIFKKNSQSNLKRNHDRRKKEIKKGLIKFVKKHNIDNFIEKHFPCIFHQIKQLE